LALCIHHAVGGCQQAGFNMCDASVLHGHGHADASVGQGGVVNQEVEHGGGLLRTKNPVTRVAQARHDVAVIVQAAVNSCSEYVHIRVLLVHSVDAFGAG
jgi:hypothetical protein